MEKNNLQPTGLADKQTLQCQQTINKVLRACADIKDERREWLLSLHLQNIQGCHGQVLQRLIFGSYCWSNGYAPIGGASANASGKKQDKKPLNKDRLIAEFLAKNVNLEPECELLRGRLFLMMQKNCVMR